MHFSLFYLGILFVLLTSFTPNNNPVIHSKNLNLTDSVMFIPNSSEGWIMLSTYLDQREDSIVLDIILERTVPANSNWNNTLTIGQVGYSFKPDTKRIINFIEQPRVWEISILPSGICLMKLLSGESPQGSVIVLPVQTRYKK